ncbi:hypothetical protein EDB86DRAFT_3107208 [Lactarius hatsudake]|nr:hypothetical protein EDB86DRAFT_3107208 [Lactarius hatsudake]
MFPSVPTYGPPSKRAPPAFAQSFQRSVRVHARTFTRTAIAPAHHAGAPESADPAFARLTHLTLPISSAFLLLRTTFPPHSHPTLPCSIAAPATPAPSSAFRRVTLRVASTLYDGLCPAAFFGALVGALKELVLALVSNVDVRTRGRLLGTLGTTSAGLKLSLKGTSDEVSLKAPYKQVGSLLPNVQALHLRTMSTEAAQRKKVRRVLLYRYDLRWDRH